jgi:hypothetical protein
MVDEVIGLAAVVDPQREMLVVLPTASHRCSEI